MEELVAKIKAYGKNDLENAWLLFCWIGENIRYVFNCKNNAAESVFRERIGVCRDFASLYHECCLLISIACLEISGIYISS
jgi:transglutaminase-like putative cysteine protease